MDAIEILTEKAEQRVPSRREMEAARSTAGKDARHHTAEGER